MINRVNHSRWWHHLILGAMAMVVLSPVMLIIWVSFGSPGAETGTFTLNNWRLVLGLGAKGLDGSVIFSPFPALTWLGNSVKISLIYASLATSIAAFAAYGLLRNQRASGHSLANALLVMQFFPSVLAIVAVYILLRKLGVFVPALGVNSHGGLLLSYLGGVAFYIWFLKEQIAYLPREYEEGARVTNATSWQIFVSIVLPLLAPAFLVTFLIAFMTSFGEFPLASILLQQQAQYTLAVGAPSYLSPQYYHWGEFAAFAVLSAMPALLLLALIQYWLLYLTPKWKKEK
ncbi:ABC transporter permease subunit [Motilimonas sp. KMU-193]|uniref:ABC transporter permease subunit n=1 Tax=Motilimonas sp. KMU-193 TaxID=3388668 RepID=UPI00396B0847